MSEIRMQEVVLVGRMVGEPIVNPDGVYFRFQADSHEEPFPCFADGKTAENLRRYLHDGDEFSIEGKLMWRKFRQGPFLVIHAKYTSYGRKLRSLHRR